MEQMMLTQTSVKYAETKLISDRKFDFENENIA